MLFYRLGTCKVDKLNLTIKIVVLSDQNCSVHGININLLCYFLLIKPNVLGCVSLNSQLLTMT